jgi:integrase
MAKVTKRIWYAHGPTGRRLKRVAYGFTAQARDGTQIRRTSAEWTKEDAEQALGEYQLGIEQENQEPAGRISFGEAIEQYLKVKARKKSIKDDERHLKALKAHFGADTPLAEISAAKISAWKADRMSAQCPATKRVYAAATINRPLAALRHLLQLAHEDWEQLPAVPRIKLEREPQGRIRWLEPDEEARLLAAACRKSKNKELRSIVVIALESGLRRSELLGLTWDRVDLSRGVIRLELTKSGKRREVPMRQAVYNTLAGLPCPREGRVFKTRSIRTAFENAAEGARLDDFHFHDTRHHFASWFMMREGSLQELKEILGHADITMTLRYAHLSPAHLRNAMIRTERQAVSAASTQDSTQEAIALSEVSSK